MRSAPVIGRYPASGMRRRSRPRLVGLVARARGPWLDRELAAGVAPWQSHAHAARSLQLTSHRRRRSLAAALERLLQHAEDPPQRHVSAVVPPRPEQVREALPAMLELAARLRSSEPVGARGIAILRALLGDITGPCYAPSPPGSLRRALEEISRCLDTQD